MRCLRFNVLWTGISDSDMVPISESCWLHSGLALPGFEKGTATANISLQASCDRKPSAYRERLKRREGRADVL
jgi:hypothetical protein